MRSFTNFKNGTQILQVNKIQTGSINKFKYSLSYNEVKSVVCHISGFSDTANPILSSLPEGFISESIQEYAD